MKQKSLIGATELVSILFVSRIFTAVTHQNTPTNSTPLSAIIAFAVGFLIDLCLIGIVVFISKFRPNIKTQKIFFILLSIIFITVCASSLALFTNFVSNEVLQINKWTVLFLMSMVSAYCAYTSLSAIGRFSLVLFFITVVSLISMFFVLIKNFHLNNFRAQEINGISNLVSQSVFMSSSVFEIISVIITFPLVKGNVKKGLVRFIIFSFFSLELIIFLITATLGAYASLTTYSFYTLTKINSFLSLERIDSLYVAIWTLLAFLRIGYFLFVSKKSLSNALGEKKHLLTVCISICFALASVFILKPDLIDETLNLCRIVSILFIIVTALFLLFSRKEKLKNES